MQCSLGTTDKLAAETRLMQIFQEAERESLGLIPPRLMRESAETPLQVHLENYLADLRTLERGEKHVSSSKARISRLLDRCRWVYLRDVSANSFTMWRSRQRKLSPKTLNEYFGASRAFFNWMVRQGLAAGNPLGNVQKVDT